MSIICVTGTNTDAGKTIATAAMVSFLHQHNINVLPIKPVQTGEPDGQGDIYTIERLSGVKGKEFIRSPEPLSPHLAARRANMPTLSLDELCQRITDAHSADNVLLVEGAGGLLVKVGADYTLADVAVQLNAPLIIVTSLGLGSLNAAELTVEAARSRNLELVGLVGGSMPADADLATRLNVEELPLATHVPLLDVIPEGAGAKRPEEFAAMARGLHFDPILQYVQSGPRV